MGGDRTSVDVAKDVGVWLEGGGLTQPKIAISHVCYVHAEPWSRKAFL